MAINKTVVLGKIEILQDGVVLLRTDAVYDEDGVEVGRRYQRRTLTPGQDVALEPLKIRQLTQIFWTAAVIAAYQAKVAAALATVGRGVTPAIAAAGGAGTVTVPAAPGNSGHVKSRAKARATKGRR